MKFSHKTLSVLSTIIPITFTRGFVTTHQSQSAFSAAAGGGASFVSRANISSIPRGGVLNNPTGSTNPTNSYTRNISRSMIFEALFGGGGGFNAKIDYTAIPYPVPDLANAALEDRVLQNGELERNGKKMSVATFAGGCFWGLELAFQRVPGVEYTAVGYTQGPETEPSYNQVCSGTTGHTEAVIVLFDPETCSYQTLLDTFFGRVNPLQVNGQGNDRGTQYRTGVYYHDEEQQKEAEETFEALQNGLYSGKKIATENKKAMPFWPAEKYHQQYLEKGGQSAAKGSSVTIRCYG